jgi:hypothetical protein
MGNTRFYLPWKRLFHSPQYLWWLVRGRPARTPHLVKQRTVIEYGARYRLATLIEAGTYYGGMIAASRKRFQRIYSIELDPRLVALARKRFAADPNVEILQGDSQELVPRLLEKVDAPALFWLDAGYSCWGGVAGNPARIGVELRAILARPERHVVLLDDANGIRGEDGAPLEPFVAALGRDFPEHAFEVRHNILRITPAGPAPRH